MELDLSDCVQRKYLQRSRNPFSEGYGSQKLPDVKYKLISMVAYDNKENYESCYLTYNKGKDGTWTKYSRFASQQVPSSEVESVTYPYVLIFERDWDSEPKRDELIAEIEQEESSGLQSSMPIPDHWISKIKHLAEPGVLSCSQLVCKHRKLKPYYRDVLLENYSSVAVGPEEQAHIPK